MVGKAPGPQHHQSTGERGKEERKEGKVDQQAPNSVKPIIVNLSQYDHKQQDTVPKGDWE